MPEQSTREALADPRSDVYQSYAETMDANGRGTFSNEENARSFAEAWSQHTGRAYRIVQDHPYLPRRRTVVALSPCDQ